MTSDIPFQKIRYSVLVEPEIRDIKIDIIKINNFPFKCLFKFRFFFDIEYFEDFEIFVNAPTFDSIQPITERLINKLQLENPRNNIDKIEGILFSKLFEKLNDLFKKER